VEEEINITKSLKPKNSKVYDTTSTKIIKHCVKDINKPLNHTFNYSLRLGTYYEKLKYSIVRPIYKKR
jgi:hypothetical protein